MKKVTLSEIADNIESHPEQFDMTVFATQHECGTVGCVAFQAALMSGSLENCLEPDFLDVQHLGRQALSLEKKDCDELFYAYSIDQDVASPLHSSEKDGMEVIQERSALVPAALRWMEKNGISWKDALEAVS